MIRPPDDYDRPWPWWKRALGSVLYAGLYAIVTVVDWIAEAIDWLRRQR